MFIFYNMEFVHNRAGPNIFSTNHTFSLQVNAHMIWKVQKRLLAPLVPS